MAVTYTVAINFNDNGISNVGDFTDSGENITADVLALHWRLGMSAPHDSVAAPIFAAITVRNVSRDYSPEYTADPLLRGKPIIIQSFDGTTTRTHFTGYITTIEPQTGDQGERIAVIHAGSIEHDLSYGLVRLPLQIDTRADSVITAILNAVPLRLPVLARLFMVGVAGHAELNTNAYLPGPYPNTLEVGVSTFAFVGDLWSDGVPADVAVRQLVDSERGRFFINRAGEAVFYNRHHLLLDVTSDATFEDEGDSLTYAYGTDVVNRIGVRLTPRSVGTPGTVLWHVDNVQTLLPGQAGFRQIIARYTDSAGRPIGALSVIVPVRGLDFIANSEPDGSGSDVTNEVEVLLFAVGASAATLELRNQSGRAAYLQPGMQLRGTPLVQNDAVIVQQDDGPSITFYGLKSHVYDLPTLTSIEEADQLARYEVKRRSAPRGGVTELRLSSQQPAHVAHILARSLFERITVRDTQTDHAADYFIVAEEHRVDAGGARHRVVWTLESAASSAFWVVGTSQLNQTTLLAY